MKQLELAVDPQHEIVTMAIEAAGGNGNV